MPHATLTCLAPGLKKIIMHEASTHISDLAERKIFLDLVAALANCQGTLIGFEVPAAIERQVAGDGRKKRAPSAYNTFIKKCASSKAKGGEGKDFKACALTWKEQKAQARAK